MQSSEIVKEKSVSVILLAGGKGKRMGVIVLSFSLHVFMHGMDIVYTPLFLIVM